MSVADNHISDCCIQMEDAQPVRVLENLGSPATILRHDADRSSGVDEHRRPAQDSGVLYPKGMRSVEELLEMMASSICTASTTVCIFAAVPLDRAAVRQLSGRLCATTTCNCGREPDGIASGPQLYCTVVQLSCNTQA
ncbi:MAG: hypothetical protein M1823_005348 [Watsoniomyces obsoletus]|nr:MAG: hypothetical protein M1823_005348 [Watsoniomyces obsoletus]